MRGEYGRSVGRVLVGVSELYMGNCLSLHHLLYASDETVHSRNMGNNGQAILPSFMIHLMIIYYTLVRVLILLSELERGLAELEEESKNMTETNLLRQLHLAYSELKRMDLIWDRVKRVCSQTYPDLISQIRTKRQVIYVNFNGPYH